MELGDARTTANGAALGEPFTVDGDFVKIRGEHLQGRGANAQGHHGTFDSICKGSSLGYALLETRALIDDVRLVHTRSNLAAPSGPLAGMHGAVGTLVRVWRETGWRIAALHNSLRGKGQGSNLDRL